ncbi:MAG: hypothetical protein ACRCVJ_03880 [Clostridium sp.]|uniref:hypothetical protein n=1 Tax=Clostridium sp. TaxID=1506 RepID=UPI003F38A9AA
MKIIFKCIVTVILACSFVNIPMEVKATEKVIEIDKSNKFSDENSKIFVEGVGILPGDSIIENITIKNSSNNIFNIKLESKDSFKNNKENELLQKIKINITHKNKLIYSGFLLDINEKNIELGTYNPREVNKLTIAATLDGESIGNDYQNKSETFDLIFTIVGDKLEVSDESNEKRDYGYMPKTGLPFKIATFVIAFILIVAGMKLIKKK